MVAKLDDALLEDDAAAETTFEKKEGLQVGKKAWSALNDDMDVLPGILTFLRSVDAGSSSVIREKRAVKFSDGEEKTALKRQDNGHRR